MGLKILLKQPGSPHFLVLSTWYRLTAWWPQIPSWVWWTGFASWCNPLGAMTFSRPCGFSSHHSGTYTIVPLLKAVSKSTWHKYKMPDSIDNTTLVSFLFFPFHELAFFSEQKSFQHLTELITKPIKSLWVIFYSFLPLMVSSFTYWGTWRPF